MLSIRLQWLCLWLLLTTAGTAIAQGLNPGADREVALTGSASLPAWVVPVLRLVSATHVEPTTGIVLSGSGLVLVPAEFASIGDEVIVLDGGTDIIRNGRPARIEKTFAQIGVDVLAVDGLRRPAASLPAGKIADGSRVKLAAFPPAEQIEQGHPHLSLPATLVVFAESGSAAVSKETPLPNVTGPLVDACGDLVGVSLAHDVQTMENSAETRYAWEPALRQVYAELGIEPGASRCAEAATNDAAEPAPAAEPEPIPAVPPAAESPEAAEEPAAGNEEPAAAEEQPDEPAATEAETLETDVLPPTERGSDVQPATEEDGTRFGLWLLGAALLVGLGLLLRRLRRASADTADLSNDSGSIPSQPEPPESDFDEGEAADAALDHQLVLEGVLPDGTSFTASCPVSALAVNVLVGRGGADLVIDSPAISRRHVSLNGSRDQLTITDLGSSNGTSINGVPVMEGEVMYVEAGDTVVLGNVSCRFEVRPGAAEPEDAS
jgi:hypothetical protein